MLEIGATILVWFHIAGIALCVLLVPVCVWLGTRAKRWQHMSETWRHRAPGERGSP